MVPVVLATPTAPNLRVTNESGETWDDPTEDLLFMLLEDIEAGEGTFLILERLSDASGDTYVQAQKQGGGHYLVERREGAPEEHWATVVADMRATHRLVTGWAFGLDDWSAHVSWTKVALDN